MNKIILLQQGPKPGYKGYKVQAGMCFMTVGLLEGTDIQELHDYLANVCKGGNYTIEEF